MSYVSDLGAMAPISSMAAKPPLGLRASPVNKLAAALKPPAQIKAEMAQHAGMGGTVKVLLLGGAAIAVWALFLRKKPGSGPVVGKTIAMKSLAQEGI